MDRQAEGVVATEAPAKGPVGAFVLLAVIFIALAFWGVWGIYNFYIPTVAIPQNFAWGIVAVSILAGCAAFFSPCAFGMLPAYLGFYAVTAPAEPRGRTAETAIKLGLAAAVGIAVPGVTLAGLILALGPPFALGLRIITADPNRAVQIIRILLGIALILLGVFHLRGRVFGSGALASSVSGWAFRTKTPVVAFFMYGMAYLIASTPCTANVMVAPILFSFATGGILGVTGTVLLMVLTMGALMILTSIAFAYAKDSVFATARHLLPQIQRAAGVLVVIMGVVIIYFTLDTRMFFAVFWRFKPPGIP